MSDDYYTRSLAGHRVESQLERAFRAYSWVRITWGSTTPPAKGKKAELPVIIFMPLAHYQQIPSEHLDHTHVELISRREAEASGCR